MRHVLPLVAVLLLLQPVAAQTAALTGVVVDAETGERLPGVNVFVSGTTRGAATATDGTFTLDRLRSGSLTVAASMVGFVTDVQDVDLQPGQSVSLRFRLRPDTRALGHVDVSVSRDRAWRRLLNRFKRLFLGDTPNADRTAFENPEVLDFEVLPPGGVAARPQAPLVVVNRGLGYRLTFHRLQFRGDAAYRSWTGALAFEELTPRDDRQRREWADARERAYQGSVRHLLEALAAGTAHAEGFNVWQVAREGQRSLFSPLSDENLAESMVSSPDDAALACLPVGGALAVEYGGEGGGQRSWLTLRAPSLCLTPQGRELDPHEVTRYGYWDRERVAELLPDDYDSSLTQRGPRPQTSEDASNGPVPPSPDERR